MTAARATIRKKLRNILPKYTRVPSSLYTSTKVEKLAKKPLKKIIKRMGGLSMTPSVPPKNRAFYEHVYEQHRPKPKVTPFNSHKTVVVTNPQVAKSLIMKHIPKGRVRNMMAPIGGKGGISPMYLYHALANNPNAYVLMRGNRLQSFALFNKSKRNLNVISANPTYGGPMLSLLPINSLKAVSDPKVVSFYEKHGFVKSGPDANGLIPMKRKNVNR